MPKLYTHMNVDLDAVASVWAWLRFVDSSAELVFVPANWDGAGMESGDVALDIEAGGKGLKGEFRGGQRHSCFASVMLSRAPTEDVEAVAPLISFVDAQDATGNAYTHLVPEANKGGQMVLLRTGINSVLRAFQAMHPQDDQAVCERMFEIFDGLLANGRKRRLAEEEARQAEIVDGRVAILRNPQSVLTTTLLLEEHGYEAVVFADGMNLGVVRRNDVKIRMDHPAIRAVVGDEPGWFFHSAGFLAARGTRKAPATTLSGVDPMALARAVIEALKSA